MKIYEVQYDVEGVKRRKLHKTQGDQKRFAREQCGGRLNDSVTLRTHDVTGGKGGMLDFMNSLLGHEPAAAPVKAKKRGSKR